MKLKRGSTSVRRLIFVADSSSTTGAGLANLAHDTASLVAYYFAGDLSNEVQITLASATLGTYTSGGFVAVDNTNMPGWYEIGIPNAALDGGNECAIQFRGAANMVPVNIYIELDAFDYQTATQPVNVTQVNGTAQTAGDLATLLTTIDDFIDTEVAAIKAKTDNLPSDPADASDIASSFSTVNSTLATIATYIDTEVAAIKAKTDNLPADPADASDIAASFSSISSTLSTIASYIDTEVAAIKAKTDNLPTDPADQSAVEAAITAATSGLASSLALSAVDAKIDVIDDLIDTEVAAIKAKTDNLPIDPADASDIAASFSTVNSTLSTIAGYLDTEVAAIKAKTDNLPTDPADQSAVEAAITAAQTAITTAMAALATATELAKVPKAGETRRYTQIAANSGSKTADVSIGNPLP